MSVPLWWTSSHVISQSALKGFSKAFLFPISWFSKDKVSMWWKRQETHADSLLKGHFLAAGEHASSFFFKETDLNNVYSTNLYKAFYVFFLKVFFKVLFCMSGFPRAVRASNGVQKSKKAKTALFWVWVDGHEHDVPAPECQKSFL